MVPHLTDVVAAGGGDGLVDHLLTHDTVKCLLDTTQHAETSLREGTMQMNIHYTLQYSIAYSTVYIIECTLNPMITNKAALCFLNIVLTHTIT